MISVFLMKLKRPIAYTLTPMIFLLLMTSWAMVLTLKNFWLSNKWGLFIIGVIILVSAIYMVIEAVQIMRRGRPGAEVPVGARG